DDERAAGLTLAVQAVAAVDEERLRCEPVPHGTAGATAFTHGGTIPRRICDCPAMPTAQYHEPPEDLDAEARTFARLIASLQEEAEEIGWCEPPLARQAAEPGSRDRGRR